MSLLREAHLRGLIDCRAARPLDRDWWLQVDWALRWLERQLYAEVAGLKYELNLALLDYGLAKEAFDHHWDIAQELQSQIERHKLPWLRIEAGPGRQRIADMTKAWKAVFGDPEDPEVARRIEATVAALRQRMARAPEDGNAFTPHR